MIDVSSAILLPHRLKDNFDRLGILTEIVVELDHL